MDSEQIKEWMALEKSARDLVRQGAMPVAIGLKRLFQILALPSFDGLLGWEIFQKVSRSNEKSCFAVRTLWCRDEDAAKLESPIERLKYPRDLEPTIRAETIELDTVIVDSFLDRLKAIRIPIFLDNPRFGTDGTCYEFSFGQLFLGVRYRWWEEPPNEWKPLSDTVLEILRYLESLPGREKDKKLW